MKKFGTPTGAGAGSDNGYDGIAGARLLVVVVAGGSAGGLLVFFFGFLAAGFSGFVVDVVDVCEGFWTLPRPEGFGAGLR